MSNFYPTTESEVRTVIGYWDDSEGSRVAGTADTVGDNVYLPATTITATGADLHLSPKPGVNIIGQGPDSILSGFGFRMIGTGGTAAASALANWKLDLNGLTTALAGATVNYGGAIIEDASFAAYKWHVTNSNPTSGENNLTLVSTAGNDAVEGLMHLCDNDNADSDCLSTKGGGATGNASTLYRVFGGEIATPGTATNDQAVSPHDGVLVEVYGATLSGNASGGNVAYEQATDGDQRSDQLLINCTLTGTVIAQGAQLKGCVVNVPTNESVFNPSILRDTRLVLTGTDTADRGITLNSTGGDIDIDRVDIQSDGSGTGLFTVSGYTGAVTANDLVTTDTYRAFDARQSTGHTLTGAALEASQYSVLAGSSNVTISGVTSDAAAFGTPVGSVTNEDPLLATTIAGTRGLVRVGAADQPTVTSGWGSAVLSAYAAATATTSLPDPFAKYWFTNNSALATDATGNHTGTTSGTLTYTDNDDDYPDVVDFSAGGYIDLSSHADDFDDVTTGTIAAVFKVSANSGTDTIFALSDGSAYWRLTLNGSGDINFVYHNGSAIVTQGTYATGAEDDGNWHRVIVRVNGSGTTFYLDGADITSGITWNTGSASDTNFLGAVSDADECYIGRFLATNNLPWAGDLAEVRVYDTDLSDIQLGKLDDDLQPKAWVYLLAGQSNMCGGQTIATASATNNRVREHDGTTYALAEDPLPHVNFTAGTVSMGLPFGKEIATNDLPEGYRVILVTAAEGGTGFSDNEWNVGNPAYTEALSRVNTAMGESAGYEFKAFIWHQGEQDTGNATDAANHKQALIDMIAAMRANVTGATATTPFVYGSLNSESLAQGANDVTVNNNLKQIAATDRWIAFTDLSDLDPISPGNVHFAADEVRDGGPMGPRYRTALNRLPGGDEIRAGIWENIAASVA